MGLIDRSSAPSAVANRTSEDRVQHPVRSEEGRQKKHKRSKHADQPLAGARSEMSPAVSACRIRRVAAG